MGGRPTVLALMGGFWPGNDSSGPNHSLRGLCQALADEFDFRIAARTHAFGTGRPQARAGETHDLGFAAVTYLAPGPAGARGLGRMLRRMDYRLLLLNGFFDRDFTLPALGLRRARLAPRRPTLLSPRGEFGGGALSLKSGRKRAWLRAVRATGLLEGVALHATSTAEARDIRQGLPWAAAPSVAANVRPPLAACAAAPRPRLPLRLVFLGRITPVKNLDYALRVLADCPVAVVYDVYGPASDPAYAQACRVLAASLPAHVQVRFSGELPNAEVPAALAHCDLLFLPTRGENFGHAIFEALSAGVPALVSDATPWRGLEAACAGFDLPLASPQAFAGALARFAALDAAGRAAWRLGARAAAQAQAEQAGGAAAHRRLFHTLVAGREAAA